MYSNLKTDTQTATISQTTTFTTVNLIDQAKYAKGFGVSINAAVNAPSAKTFDNGTSEVSTGTFPDFATIVSGDYIVIYDTDGLAWAIAADKTGSAPEPTGDLWVSIPAERKAQVDLTLAVTAAQVAAAFELAFNALVSVPFATDDSAADGTMIFTVTIRGNTTNATTKNADDSGAGTIAVVTTTAGVSSEVDITANSLSIPSHGLPTGLKGQLTSTGTLPTGYSTATDYFVIVVDANTIKLATTLVNALAGTAVDISSQGTSAAINTFTATALAGATYKVQVSVDGDQWVDLASATSITTSTTVLLEKIEPTYDYIRLVYVITAGSMTIEERVLVKGY